MSFQISIPPSRQAAARFIDAVRHSLLRATMESNIPHSRIARAIGVHRSVIHRELKGYQDITVGRVAELAWAMGKRAKFVLEDPAEVGANNRQAVPAAVAALPLLSASPQPLSVSGKNTFIPRSPNDLPYAVAAQ